MDPIKQMSSVPFCSQMTKCSAFGTQLISYVWDFNYQHKSLPKAWLGVWYEDYVGKLMAEKKPLCPSVLFTVVTRYSTNRYAILIPKNTFAMSSLWREKYAQLEFCFVLLCVQEDEAAMYSRACGEPRAQSVTRLYFLHCLLPFFSPLAFC